MPRIPHSDICYGGIPISPMGDGKHPHEGKGDIPKGLGNNPQTPRSPYLHPLEAAPSTLGGGTFDPRSLGLRKEEVPLI